MELDKQMLKRSKYIFLGVFLTVSTYNLSAMQLEKENPSYNSFIEYQKLLSDQRDVKIKSFNDFTLIHQTIIDFLSSVKKNLIREKDKFDEALARERNKRENEDKDFQQVQNNPLQELNQQILPINNNALPPKLINLSNNKKTILEISPHVYNPVDLYIENNPQLNINSDDKKLLLKALSTRLRKTSSENDTDEILKNFPEDKKNTIKKFLDFFNKRQDNIVDRLYCSVSLGKEINNIDPHATLCYASSDTEFSQLYSCKNLLSTLNLDGVFNDYYGPDYEEHLFALPHYLNELKKEGFKYNDLKERLEELLTKALKTKHPELFSNTQGTTYLALGLIQPGAAGSLFIPNNLVYNEAEFKDYLKQNRSHDFSNLKSYLEIGQWNSPNLHVQFKQRFTNNYNPEIFLTSPDIQNRTNINKKLSNLAAEETYLKIIPGNIKVECGFSERLIQDDSIYTNRVKSIKKRFDSGSFSDILFKRRWSDFAEHKTLPEILGEIFANILLSSQSEEFKNLMQKLRKAFKDYRDCPSAQKDEKRVELGNIYKNMRSFLFKNEELSETFNTISLNKIFEDAIQYKTFNEQISLTESVYLHKNLEKVYKNLINELKASITNNNPISLNVLREKGSSFVKAFFPSLVYSLQDPNLAFGLDDKYLRLYEFLKEKTSGNFIKNKEKKDINLLFEIKGAELIQNIRDFLEKNQKDFL